MKYVSAFAVPAMTLLLALSAGSLALSAHGLQDAASAARTALSKEIAAERAAANALLAIRQMPTDGMGGVAQPITVALTAHIDAIGRIARDQSVEIERIATTKTQQSYAVAAAMTQEVPMTGGKVVTARLSINGTYSHYPEFKGFLNRLAKRSAIQSIQLRASRFELTTDIYGVPDGV